MKERYKVAHMKAAYVYSTLSYAVRRKVGCIIVKENQILSFGYNGTSPGEDNTCEDEFGVTKSNVIHAEDNALRKLNQASVSCEGAYLFCTTSPCLLCSEKIVQVMIKKVFYCETKIHHGLEYLKQNNIEVEQIVV